MNNNYSDIFEVEFQLRDKKDKNIIGQLHFPFVKSDFKNANGRTYPESIIKRETEKMRQRLSKSSIAGQLGHSPEGFAKLDKMSHVVTDVQYDEKSKKAYATCEILNTSRGRDLKVLLHKVSTMGASIVGKGNVKDGVVEDNFELMQIDLVSNPSFGKETNVSADNFFESANLHFEKDPKMEDFYRILKEKNGNVTLKDVEKTTKPQKSLISETTIADGINRKSNKKSKENKNSSELSFREKMIAGVFKEN